MGYEIIIELASGQTFVIYARNVEEYGDMFKTVQNENYRRACENRSTHTMRDGRIMQRKPRGSMTVADFHAACF